MKLLSESVAMVMSPPGQPLRYNEMSPFLEPETQALLLTNA
jgi:hypothetical protein